MKQDNKKTGAVGEKAAEDWLRKKDYQIIERNFYTRFGEIDIIAKTDGRWVFVEVKTKTGDRFGEPWEMVNRKKLRQVQNMAQVYLTKNGLGEVPCRIDVVGVWLDWEHRVTKIEHWEDVQV
ncbi:YraN family protein [Patescibacteria group bacterium]|nr:YraN family protein [Patescibacteria group bacterium]